MEGRSVEGVGLDDHLDAVAGEDREAVMGGPAGRIDIDRLGLQHGTARA